MGVPAELLGRQVRCPHCKQVVLAPPAVAPSGIVPALPPPSMISRNAPTQVYSTPGQPIAPLPEPQLPQFNLPKREGFDSILGAPEESEDEVINSQPGGRLPSVPPLEITAQNGPPPLSPTRPMIPDDNPFELAGTTATTPGQSAARPAGPSGAATSELPNPFLELEPVTLPAAFVPPGAPGPLPRATPPAAATQPFPQAAPPRPVFPANPFPQAPVPVPAPVGNPFAGIDDPTLRPNPGPAPAPVIETSTEALDEPPRKRRKSRRDEEEPAPVAKAEEKPAKTGRSPRAAAPPAGGVNNIVLFSVIGYAVLITGLAVYLLIDRGTKFEPPHPLSTIPDNFGEFEPGARKKLTLYTPYKFDVDGELPPTQVAKLGGTIAVGQIEVTPLKIERRPLVIETEPVPGRPKPKTERTGNDALVLTMSIKNASDIAIHPMDPAFLRKENAGKKDFPITRVVVGKNKFFSGGSIGWPFDPNHMKRQYEQSQVNDVTALQPGQSREYTVFTDATNTKVIAAVNSAKEAMQWRVEVRRAPLAVNGKDLPVTAIIGVDFRSTDVKAVDPDRIP